MQKVSLVFRSKDLPTRCTTSLNLRGPLGRVVHSEAQANTIYKPLWTFDQLISEAKTSIDEV